MSKFNFKQLAIIIPLFGLLYTKDNPLWKGKYFDYVAIWQFIWICAFELWIFLTLCWLVS